MSSCKSIIISNVHSTKCRTEQETCLQILVLKNEIPFGVNYTDLYLQVIKISMI
ncbi:hypothetical protein ACHAXS_001895, partial [Conticribra weissflogii]